MASGRKSHGKGKKSRAVDSGDLPKLDITGASSPATPLKFDDTRLSTPSPTDSLASELAEGRSSQASPGDSSSPMASHESTPSPTTKNSKNAKRKQRRKSSQAREEKPAPGTHLRTYSTPDSLKTVRSQSATSTSPSTDDLPSVDNRQGVDNPPTSPSLQIDPTLAEASWGRLLTRKPSAEGLLSPSASSSQPGDVSQVEDQPPRNPPPTPVGQEPSSSALEASATVATLAAVAGIAAVNIAGDVGDKTQIPTEMAADSQRGDLVPEMDADIVATGRDETGTSGEASEEIKNEGVVEKSVEGGAHAGQFLQSGGLPEEDDNVVTASDEVVAEENGGGFSRVDLSRDVDAPVPKDDLGCDGSVVDIAEEPKVVGAVEEEVQQSANEHNVMEQIGSVGSGVEGKAFDEVCGGIAESEQDSIAGVGMVGAPENEILVSPELAFVSVPVKEERGSSGLALAVEDVAEPDGFEKLELRSSGSEEEHAAVRKSSHSGSDPSPTTTVAALTQEWVIVEPSEEPLGEESLHQRADAIAFAESKEQSSTLLVPAVSEQLEASTLDLEETVLQPSEAPVGLSAEATRPEAPTTTISPANPEEALPSGSGSIPAALALDESSQLPVVSIAESDGAEMSTVTLPNVRPEQSLPAVPATVPGAALASAVMGATALSAAGEQEAEPRDPTTDPGLVSASPVEPASPTLTSSDPSPTQESTDSKESAAEEAPGSENPAAGLAHSQDTASDSVVHSPADLDQQGVHGVMPTSTASDTKESVLVDDESPAAALALPISHQAPELAESKQAPGSELLSSATEKLPDAEDLLPGSVLSSPSFISTVHFDGDALAERVSPVPVEVTSDGSRPAELAGSKGFDIADATDTQVDVVRMDLEEALELRDSTEDESAVAEGLGADVTSQWPVEAVCGAVVGGGEAEKKEANEGSGDNKGEDVSSGSLGTEVVEAEKNVVLEGLDDVSVNAGVASNGNSSTASAAGSSSSSKVDALLLSGVDASVDELPSSDETVSRKELGTQRADDVILSLRGAPAVVPDDMWKSATGGTKTPPNSPWDGVFQGLNTAVTVEALGSVLAAQSVTAKSCEEDGENGQKIPLTGAEVPVADGDLTRGIEFELGTESEVVPELQAEGTAELARGPEGEPLEATEVVSGAIVDPPVAPMLASGNAEPGLATEVADQVDIEPMVVVDVQPEMKFAGIVVAPQVESEPGAAAEETQSRGVVSGLPAAAILEVGTGSTAVVVEKERGVVAPEFHGADWTATGADESKSSPEAEAEAFTGVPKVGPATIVEGGAVAELALGAESAEEVTALMHGLEEGVSILPVQPEEVEIKSQPSGDAAAHSTALDVVNGKLKTAKEEHSTALEVVNGKLKTAKEEPEPEIESGGEGLALAPGTEAKLSSLEQQAPGVEVASGLLETDVVMKVNAPVEALKVEQEEVVDEEAEKEVLLQGVASEEASIEAVPVAAVHEMQPGKEAEVVRSQLESQVGDAPVTYKVTPEVQSSGDRVCEEPLEIAPKTEPLVAEVAPREGDEPPLVVLTRSLEPEVAAPDVVTKIDEEAKATNGTESRAVISEVVPAKKAEGATLEVLPAEELKPCTGSTGEAAGSAPGVEDVDTELSSERPDEAAPALLVGGMENEVVTTQLTHEEEPQAVSEGAMSDAERESKLDLHGGVTKAAKPASTMEAAATALVAESTDGAVPTMEEACAVGAKTGAIAVVPEIEAEADVLASESAPAAMESEVVLSKEAGPGTPELGSHVADGDGTVETGRRAGMKPVGGGESLLGTGAVAAVLPVGVVVEAAPVELSLETQEEAGGAVVVPEVSTYGLGAEMARAEVQSEAWPSELAQGTEAVTTEGAAIMTDAAAPGEWARAMKVEAAEVASEAVAEAPALNLASETAAAAVLPGGMAAEPALGLGATTTVLATETADDLAPVELSHPSEAVVEFSVDRDAVPPGLGPEIIAEIGPSKKTDAAASVLGSQVDVEATTLEVTHEAEFGQESDGESSLEVGTAAEAAELPLGKAGETELTATVTEHREHSPELPQVSTSAAGSPSPLETADVIFAVSSVTSPAQEMSAIAATTNCADPDIVPAITSAPETLAVVPEAEVHADTQTAICEPLTDGKESSSAKQEAAVDTEIPRREEITADSEAGETVAVPLEIGDSAISEAASSEFTTAASDSGKERPVASVLPDVSVVGVSDVTEKSDLRPISSTSEKEVSVVMNAAAVAGASMAEFEVTIPSCLPRDSSAVPTEAEILGSTKTENTEPAAPASTLKKEMSAITSRYLVKEDVIIQDRGDVVGESVVVGLAVAGTAVAAHGVSKVLHDDVPGVASDEALAWSSAILSSKAEADVGEESTARGVPAKVEENIPPTEEEITPDVESEEVTGVLAELDGDTPVAKEIPVAKTEITSLPPSTSGESKVGKTDEIVPESSPAKPRDFSVPTTTVFQGRSEIIESSVAEIEEIMTPMEDVQSGTNSGSSEVVACPTLESAAGHIAEPHAESPVEDVDLSKDRVPCLPCEPLLSFWGWLFSGRPENIDGVHLSSEH